MSRLSTEWEGAATTGQHVALRPVAPDPPPADAGWMTAAARFEYLAFHDSLTGLPNRALFLDRLRGAVTRARREGRLVGLLYLDLDDFKRINDSFGHEAGDRVLQTLAGRFQAAVRDTDTVARLGGDEFTILVEGLGSADELTAVARKLLRVTRHTVPVAGCQLAVSASIGIALCPGDGSDASGLLRNADAAMYHAKRQGRNGFRFFSNCMAERVARRLAQAERLARALAADELSLRYQPIFAPAENRLVGVEAILDWYDPETGPLVTARLMPLLEEPALLEAATRWVLARAAPVLETGLAGSPGARLSINLSPRCFLAAEQLVAALERSGLPPSRMAVEVPETALSLEPRRAAAGCRRLRDLGVQLILDDLGSGPCALALLQRYPVGGIKLAAPLVASAPRDPAAAALAGALIAYARGRGLQVMAGGVDTPEQVELLSGLGCRIFQGDLIGPPMPAAAFAPPTGHSPAPRFAALRAAAL